MNHVDHVHHSEFQREREIMNTKQNEQDLQDSLLASNKVEQNIQEEKDLRVIDGRVNDARVCRNQNWQTDR